MVVGIDACLNGIGNGVFDIQIASNGDILSEDFFDTAILVSLFSDQRANESEVLNSQDRRGWIGNESTPGIEQGSKLWLYDQSRITREILNKISIAAKDALQWLVAGGFAESIDSVETVVSTSGIQLIVTIRRSNSKVEKKFYELWNNTAIPCVDLPTYFSVQAISGISLFSQLGNPDYAVTVLWTQSAAQTSEGLDTGGPWHPDTEITIINTGIIVGAGGAGGFGEFRSGIGYAGGGGGGAPFGVGGGSIGDLANGAPGNLTTGGLGNINGDVTGLGGPSVTPGVTGEKGKTGLTIKHDISLINNGTIGGGGGGGGGGGHTGASGADGGDGGDIFNDASPATGVDKGGPGLTGNAIDTNGFSINYITTGVINGEIT